MAASRPNTTTHSLSVLGAYSLRQTAGMGFGRTAINDFDGTYRMAFTIDGDHSRTAGVAITQPADDRLDVSVTTDGDPSPALAQTARILSVDVDGRGFDDLAQHDPVIGRLASLAPGLRPPQFCSPYEAAAWSVISARRSSAQGNRIRERLNTAHGTRFDLAGQTVFSFPTPEQLLRVESVPGLPDVAIPRLHAIARAAADGDLAIDRLTTMDPEAARADVQRLPGIGPFYSGLIVYRALGHPDVLPLIEPRSRALLEHAYGVTGLTDTEFVELAQRWRPYRMWVSFLARATEGRQG